MKTPMRRVNAPSLLLDRFLGTPVHRHHHHRPGDSSPSGHTNRLLGAVGRLCSLGALLLLATSCGHLVYSDGPYRGRVLDKNTKQPIEGAAVLAIWWKQSPMIAHPSITYYDAQETVTDADGNFTIPGIVGGSFNPLAKIRLPQFTIFKPGYDAFGRRALPPSSADGRTTLEIHLLATREERLTNLDKVFVTSDVPSTRYPNLIKLMDIEKTALGLGPINLPKRIGP
jgi:hypothetical protein